MCYGLFILITAASAAYNVSRSTHYDYVFGKVEVGCKRRLSYCSVRDYSMASFGYGCSHEHAQILEVNFLNIFANGTLHQLFMLTIF